MCVMKPICTNLCDFEALRKAGQLYVDKTASFHRLITDPSRNYFFCARPRWFGKSLGLNFDSKTRQLTDAAVETCQMKN